MDILTQGDSNGQIRCGLLTMGAYLMTYRSTRQVAKQLGVSASLLARAVWDGRVDPPQKSPSGNYLWTDRDVAHASWVLRHRAPDDAKE